MCGRLYQTLPLARLLKIAKCTISPSQSHHTSSFNVCPTAFIPAIVPSRLYCQEKSEKKDQQLEGNKQLQFMSWGSKTSFSFIVNGRIQEMMNKRTFLNIIGNRCVVIMEGYYQWNTKKEPFSFRPKGTDHFLVAALYTQNKQIILLTKDATPELAAVHHRMPVILSHQQVNLWLNPSNTKIINEVIQKSLLNKQKQIWKNIGCAKLAPYVSSIKQKTNKCLMTIQQYKKELDKTGLMRFWKKAPKVEAVDKDGNVVEVGKVEISKSSGDKSKNQQEDRINNKGEGRTFYKDKAQNQQLRENSGPIQNQIQPQKAQDNL